MVFHVGIDGGFEGYVAAYNDITKETIKFKTDGIIWNDESISNVNKICEKIQATLVGEFGYACIFIPGYYTENERKEFMNNVKRIEFKKVFIINSLTKIYMECNINLKEKSKVDDIFWIFAEYDLVIYEKTKILSKIIKIFYNPQEFDAGQPLPLEKTIALPVKSILNIMFWAVGECYYPEMKITPKMLKIREVSFVLKIDKNFIVSYYFVVDTLESPQRRVKNLYKQTFNIPHKVLIDNLNTNAVGIDLGMTRCCVAVNRTNGIELVAIDNDNRQLPSYVSFKEKDPICGQMVINQLEFYANESVFDIKRIIGRTIDEIEIHSSWPFEVIKNDKDKPMLRVHGYKSSIVKHPEEVTAILLKHTKQKVEEFQGKIMDEVVITIPAGFNQNQKNCHTCCS
uniref:Uncharacterized protein n=1 Tax=Panagrolaimus sp. PS1159 TaxID=55785 RepID=A0AC35FIV5_9BILA